MYGEGYVARETKNYEKLNKFKSSVHLNNIVDQSTHVVGIYK